GRTTRTCDVREESAMGKIHAPPEQFAQHARITAGQYKLAYRHARDQPERFWGDVGRRLDWIRPYTKVKDTSFDPDDLRLRWFEDGQLNVSANCLDRHLGTRGDKTAILWEGDDPGESLAITYRDLHERVCRF